MLLLMLDVRPLHDAYVRGFIRVSGATADEEKAEALRWAEHVVACYERLTGRPSAGHGRAMAGRAGALAGEHGAHRARGEGAMRIALRNDVTGKYARVDPSPVPAAGDAQWPVLFDRDTPGPHEELELFKDGEVFHAEFIAAGRSLCITPAGLCETREKGMRASWETFRATQQPEGINLLYRQPGPFALGVYTFEVLP